jgi:hypothetical protein
MLSRGVPRTLIWAVKLGSNDHLVVDLFVPLVLILSNLCGLESVWISYGFWYVKTLMVYYENGVDRKKLSPEQVNVSDECWMIMALNLSDFESSFLD